MLKITHDIIINESEIEFNFIRAPGPGGQNINKVATAVQLRFNVIHSPSLSDHVRTRLLLQERKKINKAGELIIKAIRFRTQNLNKKDALKRLQQILKRAAQSPKKRKKTKPTQTSIENRLTQKKRHAKLKLLRRQKFNHE